MKYFSALACVLAFAGTSVLACSSDPGADDGKGGSGNSSGSGAGTPSTAGTPGASGSGGGAGPGTAGTPSTAGTPATGGAPGTAGTPATGGTPGTAGTGGAGGAGGSGGGNPNAVVTTCAPQTYTPADPPGATCATEAVPAAKLIAAFETAGTAAGWGIYPNVDGKTGFMPTMATPSAGGANGTTMALNFTVTNVEQGIKVQVGFGTQCQDVRTFEGLSFWAKGTIDATTMPYEVAANTLVLQLGSEKSLLGGCVGETCSAAPPDKRITLSADWKEYRIPFDCFGDGKVFDGYYTNILFNAFGTNAAFSLDEVGYY